MAEALNWGLIGASRIAAGHMINAFRQTGGTITSVLSSSDERGRAYAAEHGIDQAFTDLDALLATDCNAVYISTTNEKHKDQAMAAIAAGKHVLCEKPLAMTVADAVEMVRAADAAGVTFATNHHLRNAGTQLAIKALIDDGSVGDVLSMRVHHAVHLPAVLQGWRIDNPEAGGGVIPDITVHDADTVRFHLGEDPVEVVAQAANSGMGQGVEDSAMSVWRMPSGAMVMAHESFTHAFAGTALEVHGTKGSIFAKGVMTQAPVGEITLVDASGSRAIPFSDHDLYVRSMGLFTAACGGNGAPSATGEDGIKSLAVAMAVRQAALTGDATQVDYGGV